MKDNITESQFLCTVLEVTYNKKMKHLVKKDIIELYPSPWFSLKYDTKIKILNEALKNNILISKTQLYKEILEKVKN